MAEATGQRHHCAAGGQARAGGAWGSMWMGGCCARVGCTQSRQCGRAVRCGWKVAARATGAALRQAAARRGPAAARQRRRWRRPHSPPPLPSQQLSNPAAAAPQLQLIYTRAAALYSMLILVHSMQKAQPAHLLEVGVVADVGVGGDVGRAHVAHPAGGCDAGRVRARSGRQGGGLGARAHSWQLCRGPARVARMLWQAARQPPLPSLSVPRTTARHWQATPTCRRRRRGRPTPRRRSRRCRSRGRPAAQGGRAGGSARAAGSGTWAAARGAAAA